MIEFFYKVRVTTAACANGYTDKLAISFFEEGLTREDFYSLNATYGRTCLRTGYEVGLTLKDFMRGYMWQKNYLDDKEVWEIKPTQMICGYEKGVYDDPRKAAEAAERDGIPIAWEYADYCSKDSSWEGTSHFFVNEPDTVKTVREYIKNEKKNHFPFQNFKLLLEKRKEEKK